MHEMVWDVQTSCAGKMVEYAVWLTHDHIRAATQTLPTRLQP